MDYRDMSSEKDEIRWELDKILDFVNSVIQIHQNE